MRYTNLSMPKVKKTIFSLVTLSQLLTPIAYAGETGSSKAINSAGDLLIHTLNKKAKDFDIKWIEGKFKTVGANNEFEVTVFKGLKETYDSFIFSQTTLSNRAKNSTLNNGIGFYNLIDSPVDLCASNKKIIVGANIFLDVRSQKNKILSVLGNNTHKRFSVGGVVKTANMDAYANIYRAITTEIDGYKAMNGYDFGINGKVPGFEQIELGVSRYNFSGDTSTVSGISSAIKGNKYKIDYSFNNVISVGAEYDDRNNKVNNISTYISAKYNFGEDLQTQLNSPIVHSTNVWDKRYDKVERDNTLHIEKVIKYQELTTATTFSGVWGTPVQVTGMSNKSDATGAWTYTKTGGTATGGTVSLTGSVAATGTGTVILTVARAADDKYEAILATTVTVTFTKQASASAFSITEPTAVAWGTPSSQPTIAGHDATTMGAITYSTTQLANTGGTLDASTGIITGSTKPGTVTVTATTAGGTHYSPITKTFDVKFGAQTQALSISNQTTVWGTSKTIPTVAAGNSVYSFAMTGSDTAGGSVAVHATTGAVTGATRAGTAIVKVTRTIGSDKKYATTTQDVTVTFTAQTQTLSTASTASGEWGTPVQVTGTSNQSSASGAWKYTKSSGGTAPSGGAVSNTGAVTATGPGTVILTVERAADAKYKAIAATTITVTFAKKNIAQALTTANTFTGTAWGTAVQVTGTSDKSDATGDWEYTKIGGTAETGAVSLTGEVTAAGPGTVVLTVARAADDKYAAIAATTITVTFAKKPKSYIQLIGRPTWENQKFQIKMSVTGLASGAPPVIYSISDTSIATVYATSGLITIIKTGLVIFTATSANDKYETSIAQVELYLGGDKQTFHYFPIK